MVGVEGMGLQNAESTEMQDLLEFVHRIPIGIIRFRTDGTIDMINPAAIALLLKPTGQADFGNIYESLSILCPELGTKVAAFAEPSGTILDKRRIDGRAGRQTLVLSMTVSRVRADVHMAVLRDVSKLTDMLAYAFAAADLLIDVDADGVIGWAGGAFRSLLDMRPQDAVGTAFSTLISPRDRESLAQALMVIGARGRLPPLLLRLANEAESPCVLSGLRVGGSTSRYLLTVGPEPKSHISAAPAVRSGREFSIELETWVRNGQAGSLELLDIKDWARTSATLDETQVSCLTHALGSLAAEAGRDLVVGEIGGGRFCMLGGNDDDLARCARALEALIGSFSGAGPATIDRSRIDLAGGSLSLSRSVQALRLVLTRFAANGAAGVASAGLADGLAGIIAHASAQRRALAAAIAGGGFNMVYQPIVRLVDRTVHHYEALLRPAANPALPAGNPQEFVTLVEIVGLSRELDLAVLERAVAQTRHCDANIAVNISGLSIADPAFTADVLKLAAAAPRGRLLIELTETAEIRNLPAAAVQIDRMRAAHIKVCLDDFGAGSASFRYLRDLRVDFVKIDGTYVRAAGESEQGRSFVRAMRDLATSCGAAAIAEMVETEEDAALMRELGVAFGQGWLFGKPGPIAAEPAKLTRWRY